MGGSSEGFDEGIWVPSDNDVNEAFFAEFASISDEIKQDLGKSVRIELDIFGEIFGNMKFSLEFLLLDGDFGDFPDFFDQFMEVFRLGM